ncbi:alkaline phosphatase family protein [Vagococcus vulneris]|uniref:Alkaline phosphatase family protein n=1 Tax=Vagococcus vulneris TaxID=1977869 RepID=A0A430A2L1_9ENTE|nr:ectonucleotide pyrophosphatase/phosphodiesterase [Vagococcus vulneris]RSU00713.1 alkaline phosphatase family protein [Vagococcus vulneris]
MTKKLLIISIDALGAKNIIEQIDYLPTIKSLLTNGTWVKEIAEVYPSLTYPSHTTIVTGVYPNKHGIINNTKKQMNRRSPDWYWYSKDVKVTTLYEAARQKRLKTAAFLWPVTAGSNINYNIAEIFPNRIWTNQVLTSLKASTPYFMYQMNRKFGHLRQGIKQPYLDDFVTACAVDTIKTKKPDLTMIHLVDLDSMYHAYGVESEQAYNALLRQDKRILQLLSALDDAGMRDETNIVILGDHYQIDVHTMIRINSLFTQKGWMTKTKNELPPRNASLYAKSTDGSCYIYADSKNRVDEDTILAALKTIKGIEKIYLPPDIQRMGADTNALFMLEAKSGYYFIDEANGHIIEEVNQADIGKPDRYRAVHGYHPTKPEYATTLIFNGPDIKSGHVIPKAKLIDEAPTFAELLGITDFSNHVDGSVIKGIFKQ